LCSPYLAFPVGANLVFALFWSGESNRAISQKRGEHKVRPYVIGSIYHFLKPVDKGVER